MFEHVTRTMTAIALIGLLAACSVGSYPRNALRQPSAAPAVPQAAAQPAAGDGHGHPW